jgi:hypothetical protein
VSTSTDIGIKHPVIHFEIMGNDPGKLRSFYTDVFGWKIAKPHEGDPLEYNTIDTGTEDEHAIGGGIGKVSEGCEGHVTFYVRVDDVEAALKKVEANGGTRRMGPDTVPMPNGASIVIGLFLDPEGHTIGLVDVGDAM